MKYRRINPNGIMLDPSKWRTGMIIPSGNFKLGRKIETFEDLWHVLKTNKSLFVRHRMYPTAFFFSWGLKTTHEWISRGWFWTVYPNIKANTEYNLKEEIYKAC